MKKVYIIQKIGEPEKATTWGEMCGDYQMDNGCEYVQKVVCKKFTDITQYKHLARIFKTRKAADKALDLRYSFYADENRTLRNEGFEIAEIELED